MPRNQFNNNLRALMALRGWNNRQLAARLTCCNQANVSTWRRRVQPSYDMLIRIAEVFEVTVDALIKEEINKQPK